MEHWYDLIRMAGAGLQLVSAVVGIFSATTNRRRRPDPLPSECNDGNGRT
jgi:hypothetical protein